MYWHTQSRGRVDIYDQYDSIYEFGNLLYVKMRIHSFETRSLSDVTGMNNVELGSSGIDVELERGVIFFVKPSL